MRPADVFPLELLPRDKQEWIADAVASDAPPERWMRYDLFQMESRAWYEWHWARGQFPGSMRQSVSPALRRRVIERDGYICQLCAGDVEPTDVHIDHIHPCSKGGLSVLGNLQVTHSRCNLQKGARY